MSIGDRIRDCRKLKKITQVELASLINRSPQVISNWERGYTPVIPHDDILELAIALETTPNYLLGLTDDPTPPQASIKEPSPEEYVLAAPGLGEAVVRIANLAAEDRIDEKEYLRLNALAFKKFGLPPAKDSEKAAYLDINIPGTGVFEGDKKDK